MSKLASEWVANLPDCNEKIRDKRTSFPKQKPPKTHFHCLRDLPLPNKNPHFVHAFRQSTR